MQGKYGISGAGDVVGARLFAGRTDGGPFMYSHKMFNEIRHQTEGRSSTDMSNHERRCWQIGGLNQQMMDRGSFGMLNYQRQSLQMGGINPQREGGVSLVVPNHEWQCQQMSGIDPQAMMMNGKHEENFIHDVMDGRISVIRGDGVRESIFAIRNPISSKERDGLSQLNSFLFLISSIDESNDRMIHFKVRNLVTFHCYKNLLESWDVARCFYHDESQLMLVLGDEMFLVALQFVHAILHKRNDFIAGQGEFGTDYAGYHRALNTFVFARIHFMNKR